MKTAFIIVIAVVVMAGVSQSEPKAKPENQAESPARAKTDPFAPLRPLVGRWNGEGDGQPGQSTVERSYEFVMDGRFLHVQNTSTYAPQEKNPKGEKHEDWGMLSFDGGRKKLVLRQFHIEGFVNQYILDTVSADGKEIVFVTEAIENIPPGFRGRETYKFIGPDAMQETFEIAEPGKDFEIYCTNMLRRVE
jgi:hypothetical protein